MRTCWLQYHKRAINGLKKGFFHPYGQIPYTRKKEGREGLYYDKIEDFFSCIIFDMGLCALVCLKIGAPFHIPTMHSCISLNTLAFSLSVRLKQSKNEISLSIILSISFLFIIQIFISTLIAKQVCNVWVNAHYNISRQVCDFLSLWVKIAFVRYVTLKMY